MQNNFINIIVDWFGIATLGCLIAFVGANIVKYLKKLIKKQTKIKCLCVHEYIRICVVETNKYIEFTLKCRKCGKQKTIKIYKTGGEINE